MLTNLLPGLRDLRTPLAAGYVLLLALYLFLTDKFPRLLEQDGAVRYVAPLASSLGPAPTLAALTFAAYLAGVLFEGTLYGLPHPSRLVPKFIKGRLPNSLKEWVLNRRKDSQRAAYYLVQSRFENALESDEQLVERLRELEERSHADSKVDGLDKGHASNADTPSRSQDVPQRFAHRIARVDVYRHLDQVEGELEQIPSRLLGKEPELWSSWDRLNSEGEFRFVMAYCSCVFALVLSICFTPLWLLVLPACFQLLLLSRKKTDEARVLLVEALIAGRISSESVDRMNRGDFYLYEDGGTVNHSSP